MQASKNGFFYVLDRATGEFLSGKPFAYMNWTKGLDPEHASPDQAARRRLGPSAGVDFPAVFGAHGWQPMSYQPENRPGIHAGIRCADDLHRYVASAAPA